MHLYCNWNEFWLEKTLNGFNDREGLKFYWNHCCFVLSYHISRQNTCIGFVKSSEHVLLLHHLYKWQTTWITVALGLFSFSTAVRFSLHVLLSTWVKFISCNTLFWFCPGFPRLTSKSRLSLTPSPPKRPVDINWGTCEYVYGPLIYMNFAYLFVWQLVCETCTGSGQLLQAYCNW